MNLIVHQLYMSILAAYMKVPEIPITCPIQQLTTPVATWDFPVRLSCNNSHLDGARSGARLNMPIGSECTYIYSCTFDAPNTAREVTKVCQGNGKWSEEMPECTEADELAESILDVFGHISPSENEGSMDEQPTVTEEASTESSTEIERESSTSSAERPASSLKKKSSSKSRSLKRLCDSQKMCTKLRSLRDCPRIVPRQFLNSRNSKFNQTLFKVFTGLCYHCFRNYCTGPGITLL